MDPSINKDHIFFKRVHPFLHELFYKLYTSRNITLQPFSGRESLASLSDSNYIYAYRLPISYATIKLYWDVIFNPHDLTQAPDFTFNDEPFEEYLYKNKMNETVLDWVYWDAKKPESLDLVIQSFIKLFTKFQENELQRTSAIITEEYQLIKSLEKDSHKYLEVYVDDQTTYFLIALKVDLSQLPEFIQNTNKDGSLINPMQDNALLAVDYNGNDSKSVTVHLHLSPRVSQFIGKSINSKIPPCGNTPIVEYIQKISKITQMHVDKAAYNFLFKKEFISAIIAKRGTSIIEYDAFHMSFVIFLCDVGGSYFLVRIEAGEQFPQEKASVVITSFHNYVGEKIIFEYKNCLEVKPYEIAIHILDELKTHLVNTFNLEIPMVTE